MVPLRGGASSSVATGDYDHRWLGRRPRRRRWVSCRPRRETLTRKRTGRGRRADQTPGSSAASSVASLKAQTQERPAERQDAQIERLGTWRAIGPRLVGQTNFGGEVEPAFQIRLQSEGSRRAVFGSVEAHRSAERALDGSASLEPPESSDRPRDLRGGNDGGTAENAPIADEARTTRGHALRRPLADGPGRGESAYRARQSPRRHSFRSA